MSARRALEAAGVKVLEVDGLQHEAVWVREAHVLLVAPGISEETMGRAVETALGPVPTCEPVDDGGAADVVLVLGALGVTVLEAPAMRDAVCYVEDQRIGLVRAGLPPKLREEALEWLLHEVCEAD